MDGFTNLKCLTGIRGFAVLLVLLSHAGHSGFYVTPYIDFSGAGRYGVFLFFVLSSFLLTRQFLMACDIDRKDWRPFIYRYFRRRILRIYPLFTAALVVYLLIGILFQPVYIYTGKQVITSMLLLDGPGIFWTIPVEFQYYFLIPVISIILIQLRFRPVFLLVVFSLVIGIWQQIFQPEYKPNLIPFLSIFLMGSLAAYQFVFTSQVGTAIGASSVMNRVYGLLALCLLVLLIVLIPNFCNAIFSTNYEMTAFHNEFILFGSLSSLFILATLKSRGIIKRLMESALMQFWGRVSFSAYLLHMLVLKGVEYLNMGSGPVPLLVFLVSTAIVSYFSWKYIEKRFSRNRTEDQPKNSIAKCQYSLVHKYRTQ